MDKPEFSPLNPGRCCDQCDCVCDEFSTSCQGCLAFHFGNPPAECIDGVNEPDVYQRAPCTKSVTIGLAPATLGLNCNCLNHNGTYTLAFTFAASAGNFVTTSPISHSGYAPDLTISNFGENIETGDVELWLVGSAIAGTAKYKGTVDPSGCWFGATVALTRFEYTQNLNTNGPIPEELPCFPPGQVTVTYGFDNVCSGYSGTDGLTFRGLPCKARYNCNKYSDSAKEQYSYDIYMGGVLEGSGNSQLVTPFGDDNDLWVYSGISPVGAGPYYKDVTYRGFYDDPENTFCPYCGGINGRYANVQSNPPEWAGGPGYCPRPSMPDEMPPDSNCPCHLTSSASGSTATAGAPGSTWWKKEAKDEPAGTMNNYLMHRTPGYIRADENQGQSLGCPSEASHADIRQQALPNNWFGRNWIRGGSYIEGIDGHPADDWCKDSLPLGGHCVSPNCICGRGSHHLEIEISQFSKLCCHDNPGMTSQCNSTVFSVSGPSRPILTCGPWLYESSCGTTETDQYFAVNNASIGISGQLVSGPVWKNGNEVVPEGQAAYVVSMVIQTTQRAPISAGTGDWLGSRVLMSAVKSAGAIRSAPGGVRLYPCDGAYGTYVPTYDSHVDFDDGSYRDPACINVDGTAAFIPTITVRRGNGWAIPDE